MNEPQETRPQGGEYIYIAAPTPHQKWLITQVSGAERLAALVAVGAKIVEEKMRDGREKDAKL